MGADQASLASRRTPRIPIRLHGTLLGSPAPQLEQLKNPEISVIFVEIVGFLPFPGFDNVMVALVNPESA